MLGVSFAIVYGLSVVQINNQDNRYISILISLAISLQNMIIGRKYYILFRGYKNFNSLLEKLHLNKASNKFSN
jgi:hypothetical protein